MNEDNMEYLVEFKAHKDKSKFYMDWMKNIWENISDIE